MCVFGCADAFSDSDDQKYDDVRFLLLHFLKKKEDDYR